MELLLLRRQVLLCVHRSYMPHSFFIRRSRSFPRLVIT
jgi:hypothetical protein